jgi:Putative prokaryotic signal transducing protein
MAVPFSNPEPASKRDPNNEKERWRLAWHYADMTDGELQSLASESGSLTEVARRALQSELHRRKLPIELAQPAVAALAAAAGAAGQPRGASPANPNAPAGAKKPAKTRGGLATVRRFRDVPEALLAKSVLESAGIECLLADANIIRTDWLWSNLVGGVKVRVQEEDLEEATRILDQEPPERFAGAGQNAGDFEPPCCPRCKSPDVDVSFENVPEPTSAPDALAGAPPTDSDPEWTCQSCGNRWHELEPTG